MPCCIEWFGATFKEEKMRKLILAFSTTTVLLAGMMGENAQAAAAANVRNLQPAINDIGLVENVQYIYGGRRHCWYEGGWHGPGWYWCGYAWRRGFGWGGERGWQGWDRREDRREWREERREHRRY
jgi:hypothetical protein